jgi:exodeoxyribonuclease VII small subunit
MAKKSFEDALAKLEEITRELEDGELSLERSLKMFEEGVKLAEFCNRTLDEAQTKVDMLLKKNDGTVAAVPFEFDQEDDSAAE